MNPEHLSSTGSFSRGFMDFHPGKERAAACLTRNKSLFTFGNAGENSKGKIWPTARQQLRRTYIFKGSPRKSQSKSTPGHKPFLLEGSKEFTLPSCWDNGKFKVQFLRVQPCVKCPNNMGVYVNIISPYVFPTFISSGAKCWHQLIKLCYTGICKLCGEDLKLSPKTGFHETIPFCLIIHTFLSFIISIFFYFPKGPEEGGSFCTRTHTVLMPSSTAVQTQS